jgi:hypothetical protein
LTFNSSSRHGSKEFFLAGTRTSGQPPIRIGEPFDVFAENSNLAKSAMTLLATVFCWLEQFTKFSLPIQTISPKALVAIFHLPRSENTKILMLSIWNRRHSLEPPDQIDQAIHHRNYRLIAGLSLDQEFHRVRGALVVSIGHGKFLRLRNAVERAVEIPASLKKACCEYHSGSADDLTTFYSLLSDLAAIKSSVVEKLKVEAGKYVDRILAVSVIDPGVWRNDFDGRLTYSPFCDATRLAELCGISVIDNFPAADLASGGTGTPLSPLPWWLLAADRNRRIAKCERWILQIDRETTLLRIPTSDGLDAELPDLQLWQLEDNRFVSWVHVHTTKPVDESKAQTSVRESEYLTKSLTDALEHFFRSTARAAKNDLVCCFSEIEKNRNAVEQRNSSLRQLSTQFPELSVSEVSELGFTSEGHHAVIAAMLGLMHIDQMPANVPWLTGADGQRILGRLTLGRPSSWRQLIRAMADYQPAAMKLKDAI